MPIARFQMPDGRIGRFEVPDGTTPEQAQQMISEQVGGQQATAQPTAPEKQSWLDEVKSGAGNALAGAVRGAGSIGATLIAPYDIAKDVIAGKGLSFESNRDRRTQMDQGLQSMGADPKSLAYQGGKLGGEIAGTLGVGGALAGGAKALGAAPKIISALESGGMALGSPASTNLAGRAADVAIRAGAGAAVGGVSAGAVNPEHAGAGAVIGAASYPAVKGAAMVGRPAVKGAAMVGRGVKNLVGSVVSNSLGVITGAGAESIRQAFNAGKNKSDAFLQNLTGKVNMTEVLDYAKDALNKLRLARGDEYRANMAQVSSDKTVLDYAPIADAINKLQSMGSFKGQVINKNASGTVQELTDQVANWGSLNPAEFHTPEGLDALKKAIGDIRDASNFGTPARKAADTVYNAVKKQIADQAPVYSKTMKDYSEASDLITEIQKAFSLNEKASADTGMRKLQSLMRNNVNTNYGNRLDLARELEKAGASDLLPSIAGQALNSWTPRGLMAAAGIGGAIANPAAIPLLAAGSPRLMGNAMYGLGRGGAVATDAMNGMGRMIGNQGGGLLSSQNGVPMSLLAGIPAVTYAQR